MSNQVPKILVYDIETTDLNADVGHALCMCYKWVGNKRVYTLRIDDFPLHKKKKTDDYELIKACRDVLTEADMAVSWYGRDGCFDTPFLRTRMLHHKSRGRKGVEPLPPMIHWDGQYQSRRFLRMRANRLVNAGRLVGLDIKTDFDGAIWEEATAGERKAMNYIVDHCKKDVLQLEHVYLLMRPYMPRHPNMNVIAMKEGHVCDACLSRNLRRHGYAFKQTRRYHRYCCKDCGKWVYHRASVDGASELRS